MFFVVRDRVADVVHHHPRKEAGFLILGNEVVFGASAPKHTGVDTKHADDAVIFFGVVFKNGGPGGNEIVGHEFLDFGGIGDFVEKKGAIWLDYKRHFVGFFGGAGDNFALKPNWKLGELGLHVM